ncbi:hypothetical protein RRG08_003394 [Elysia crispata]|uniref:Uncharacterized protein n=1 Tax=Elysia crispata TaxID=231223 RepID=A0AAE1ACM7_9GAST|nr:hypothetical protein RRG08_003394 [Elysia crispata]
MLTLMPTKDGYNGHHGDNNGDLCCQVGRTIVSTSWRDACGKIEALSSGDGLGKELVTIALSASDLSSGCLNNAVVRSTGEA